MSQISTDALEPKPNVDLGILIGLLLTDGSVSFSSRSWKIVFSSKSEVLLNVFRNKMQNLFDVKSFSENIDRFKVKSLIVRNKDISNLLFKFTPTFRTKQFKDGSFPQPKIPDFIQELPKNELSEVIKVMFSADGSIVLGVKWNKFKRSWVFTRRVQITTINPFLKNQLVKILKENFQMKPQVWPKEIALERKEDILKFCKEIGFVKGLTISKKSKNWCGLEKNKILELAIRTFGLEKRDLEHFKTKEEVIDFLKNIGSSIRAS